MLRRSSHPHFNVRFDYMDQAPRYQNPAPTSGARPESNRNAAHARNRGRQVLTSTRMHLALEHVDHRPWSLPSWPWIMEQTWHDLLFAHWPIGPEAIHPLVPT